MTVWTWGDIADKVSNDLDLNGETFISPEELLGYGNAALDEASKEVMGLYDEYFEAEAPLALTSGTSLYALPTDIYAIKITLITYNDGATKYEIVPLKDKRQIPFVQETDDYRYRIINQTGQGFKLKLYPPSRETSASNVTIFYYRTPTRFVDETTQLDIPEAAQFIIQHVKDACINKEAGTLYSAPPSAALEKQRQLLKTLLDEMKPDANNNLVPDTSFYEDYDIDCFGGDY